VKGRCEICGAFGDLVRDHDHASGMIRGMLCDPCNGRLGLYEKELRRGKQRRHGSKYVLWVFYFHRKILAHLEKNTGVAYVPFPLRK
jgi:hypothetical protein